MSKSELAVNQLLDLRDSIQKSLSDMETILNKQFPEEYSMAYQHWIPQIITALYNDTKWLPRGQFSMQDTINHINDENGSDAGVSKYIK